MKIYVKKIENLTLPTQASEVAAGYDIIATSDPKIVGEKTNADGTGPFWKNIDYIEYETNLYIAPSVLTFHTLIHPRSSISKYNLILANSIGLIDNDYRGMVLCRFKYVWQPNDFCYVPTPDGNTLSISSRIVGGINADKIYKKGDRIAQLVIAPTIQVDWDVVDTLPDTQRGSGGFGSTDKPEMLPTGHPAVKVPKFVQDIAGLYQTATDGGPTRPKTYSEIMRERSMTR